MLALRIVVTIAAFFVTSFLSTAPWFWWGLGTFNDGLLSSRFFILFHRLLGLGKGRRYQSGTWRPLSRTVAIYILCSSRAWMMLVRAAFGFRWHAVLVSLENRVELQLWHTLKSTALWRCLLWKSNFSKKLFFQPLLWRFKLRKNCLLFLRTKKSLSLFWISRHWLFSKAAESWEYLLEMWEKWRSFQRVFLHQASSKWELS